MRGNATNARESTVSDGPPNLIQVLTVVNNNRRQLRAGNEPPFTAREPRAQTPPVVSTYTTAAVAEYQMSRPARKKRLHQQQSVKEVKSAKRVRVQVGNMQTWEAEFGLTDITQRSSSPSPSPPPSPTSKPLLPAPDPELSKVGEWTPDDGFDFYSAAAISKM